MLSNIALRVSGISKAYEFHSSPGARFVSLLAGGANKAKRFQALEPLSFEVEKGAFLGILGQNGSGKSTLLQLIAGIVSPSTGYVETEGKIAALLELGAGFNPEFTGRENARLNAQILGISPQDFQAMLPEIEAFAGIGEFIDRPVKTYSSGMFVRLAFSVQACINPDILIVDEALAVGDIFFRLKCYERLNVLRKRGCTVILVTHSMEDILQYCDKALLLDHGRCIYFGEPNEAINRYYALAQKINGVQSPRALGRERQASETWLGQIPVNPRTTDVALMDVSNLEQMTDGYARCVSVLATDDQGNPKQVFVRGDTVHFFVEFAVQKPIQVPVGGFVIRTEKGVVVHGRNTGQTNSGVPREVDSGTRCRYCFSLSLDIAQGEYLVDFGFASWPLDLYLKREQATMAELESSATRHSVLSAAMSISIVTTEQLGFKVQPFYGLCDLRGDASLTLIQSVDESP